MHCKLRRSFISHFFFCSTLFVLPLAFSLHSDYPKKNSNCETAFKIIRHYFFTLNVVIIRYRDLRGALPRTLLLVLLPVFVFFGDILNATNTPRGYKQCSSEKKLRRARATPLTVHTQEIPLKLRAKIHPDMPRRSKVMKKSQILFEQTSYILINTLFVLFVSAQKERRSLKTSNSAKFL